MEYCRKRAKYQYLIKVKPKTKDNPYGQKNYCEYPRENVRIRKVRGFGTVYFQYDKTIKTVTYDKSLWLTEVLLKDEIEEEIINIKNTWPDWYSIDVYPIQNKVI